MEENYVKIIEILLNDELDTEPINDVNIHENITHEEELSEDAISEDEQEDQDDFDEEFILPFQKEFVLPQRDRAFSWDISIENDINSETIHSIFPTADVNSKLIFSSARIQLKEPNYSLMPTSSDRQHENEDSKSLKFCIPAATIRGSKGSIQKKSKSNTSNGNDFDFDSKGEHDSIIAFGNLAGEAFEMYEELSFEDSPSQSESFFEEETIESSTSYTKRKRTSQSKDMKLEILSAICTSTEDAVLPILQLKSSAKKNDRVTNQMLEKNDKKHSNLNKMNKNLQSNSKAQKKENLDIKKGDSDFKKPLKKETASSSSASKAKLTPQDLKMMTPLASNAVGTLNSSRENTNDEKNQQDFLNQSEMFSKIGSQMINKLEHFLNPNGNGFVSPEMSELKKKSLTNGTGFSRNKEINSEEMPAPYGNSSRITDSSTKMHHAGITSPSLMALSNNFNSIAAITPTTLYCQSADGRVGIYSKEERQAKIRAFRYKKSCKIWRKQIKYDCRKRLADNRPRVKGRFVSRKGDPEVPFSPEELLAMRQSNKGNNAFIGKDMNFDMRYRMMDMNGNVDKRHLLSDDQHFKMDDHNQKFNKAYNAMNSMNCNPALSSIVNANEIRKNQILLHNPSAMNHDAANKFGQIKTTQMGTGQATLAAKNKDTISSKIENQNPSNNHQMSSPKKIKIESDEKKDTEMGASTSNYSPTLSGTKRFLNGNEGTIPFAQSNSAQNLLPSISNFPCFLAPPFNNNQISSGTTN